MSDAVLTEAIDGVLIITINRPEAKNAVNKAVAVGIAAALEELDGNDDLRCGILTGAGGTFCSGMDLKAFVTGEMPIIDGRGFAGMVEKSCDKPLIAAIEGYALAGGFEIMLGCDMAVSADNAKFGIPEVKRGLAAAGGGLMRMPKVSFKRIAMELALTGDFLDAGRAATLGLVNRVVPAGGALDEAKKLAAAIAANGPLAVIRSKQVINQSADWTDAEMWDKQNELLNDVFVSEDAIEGATAFAEKRAPNWKGK